MAVRTMQQVPQQMKHDKSLSKNEKDSLQKTAPSTKVCLNYIYVYGTY